MSDRPLSIRRQHDRTYSTDSKHRIAADAFQLKTAINDALMDLAGHNQHLADQHARRIIAAWPGFRRA